MTDFDVSTLDVAPMEDTFVTPDHTATKERPPILGRSFLGRTKKEDESPRPRAQTRKKSAPSNVPGQFIEPLTDLYTSVATLLFPLDPHCASVILTKNENEDSPHYGKTQAQICAESLDKAAQQNESLRRVLTMLTTGGTWGAVLAAHAPILLAIATHHTPLMENVAKAAVKNMGVNDDAE